MYVHHLLT